MLSGIALVPLGRGAMAAPVERIAPATWSIEIVDNAGDAGSYDSLALNGANRPRISYSGDPQLRFAYKDGTGWHRQTVDSAGFSTSLALDRFGHPFVSYLRGFSGDGLGVALAGRTGWRVASPDPEMGENTSIAIDATGVIHVSYDGYFDKQLRYASISRQSTIIETIDPTTGYMGSTSLAIDPVSQLPRIAYVDYDNFSSQKLKYTKKLPDGNWDVHTVASATGGTQISLALDADGLGHISFLSSSLSYASENPDGTWNLQIVDPSGAGDQSSLALDSNGLAHIAYYDPYPSTNIELDYAVETSPGQWQTQVVDSNGDPGQYPSLKLDSMGRAHISYYQCNYDGEMCDGELKYASQIG
jgi:hypothetical protein